MLSDKEIQQFRITGTIKMIKIELESVDINDLITDLFVYTDDPISKELIKKYESQLILAKLDFNKFSKGLLKFFYNTKKFIEENNLHKKYFEFCYFIYTSLNDKKINKHIINAYQDLLIEQFSRLSKLQTIICGVTSDNKLFYTNEFYPFLEYPIAEYNKRFGMKGVPKWDKLFNLFKNYGYNNIKNLNDMQIYLRDDQIITNMFYQMSNFINETTQDILPNKIYLPSHSINKIREFENSDFYIDKLKDRKYMLPFNGVIGKYINSGDIKEILFKERFIYDDLIPLLLFKVKFLNDDEIMGFYDAKFNLFYTYWKDTNGKQFHNIIENFILENYWHLVCDINISVKRNFILKRINSFSEQLNANQPGVIFTVKKREKSGKIINRIYNKEDYKAVWTEINPFVRKLPIGATASNEAKKLAREMGYVLKNGETFVRPHIKKTYRKDN